MNVCDVGPRVKEVWGDQWKETVRAPEYPMHVVLEGEPKEFAAYPFMAFAKPGTTFIILPLTPRIAEALHRQTLISDSVYRQARDLAADLRRQRGAQHEQVSQR